MAYMPKEYKRAQQAIRDQIQAQWSGPLLAGPIGLHFYLKGEARGDIDNIIGTFMDCATGIIWARDSVGTIPLVHALWEKSCKADSEWTVRITDIGR